MGRVLAGVLGHAGPTCWRSPSDWAGVGVPGVAGCRQRWCRRLGGEAKKCSCDVEGEGQRTVEWFPSLEPREEEEEVEAWMAVSRWAASVGGELAGQWQDRLWQPQQCHNRDLPGRLQTRGGVPGWAGDVLEKLTVDISSRGNLDAVVLTLGAGDITRLGPKLLSRLQCMSEGS
ncbi:hypothetical protein Taro_004108 [Colocasia esculenta]|uniref:Uncharacterized protein n=1 Tax=Colocasia esculenta TaxID=4460 RepID=A0A843TP48_COLES|nr:hypothetical protein [Colocasia esculenta]